MIVPKTSAERIKLARNIIGASRNVLTEKYDFSYNTLQSLELGRTPLSVSGAKKLSAIFTKEGLLCTSEWLLNGAGRLPEMMLGIDLTIPQEMADETRILYEVEIFKSIRNNAVIYLTQDDGMHPTYLIGDYVGGIKKTGEEIVNLIGNNCIVETKQGEILTRKLLKGSKEFLYSLLCVNTETHDVPIIMHNVKLSYAAKVIWHRTKE